MSYRCGACGHHVPDGQKLLRHLVCRRTRHPTTGDLRIEIDREIPVCQTCSAELLQLKVRGVPSADALSIVQKRHEAPSGLKILDRFPDAATA